ncbi:hypothetical protein OC834_007326, partial [Tilletia horrida]
MCEGHMYGSSEAYFQSRKFLHEPPIAKKMYDACFLKFVNNPRLRAHLIATGEAYLVEAGPEDDKTGRNELGHVLVAVREALKANTES